MNQRTYVSGRRSALGPVVFAVGIILLAVVGGALLLHATGTIHLPFLGEKEAPPAPVFDTTGKVRLPINVRPIEAYSGVHRNDVLNPRTRMIEVVWLPEEAVPKDAVREARSLWGRVLRHDKAMGEIFLESEFYPKGTRPGPAAGVPPGKRAMRLSSSAVPGLHGLRQGDRFDIVMTVEVQIEAPRRTNTKNPVHVEGPYAKLADKPDPTATAAIPRVKRKRAEVRVVVRNGLLVKPVHHREQVAGSGRGAVLGAMPAGKKPIEELIIAVEPSEVSDLNQALAIDAQLHVAIRSGQATKDGSRVDDGEIPDKAIEVERLVPPKGADAGQKVKLIEVIVGGKKRIIAVPEGADEEEAPKDDG